MLASIVIGTLIFGYTGWMLARHIRRSTQGKCAACATNKTCQTSCTPEKQAN